MERIRQILLIGSFLPLCWLAMMGVHELGHVMAAWFTGGTVTKVVVHPLAISRTDVSPNPEPLIVAWAGPLMGVGLPLLAWCCFCWGKLPGAGFVRFFAGFCLIANGAYIGVGSFHRVGDAGDIVRLGSPIWTAWLFGAVGIAAGLALWHGGGRPFGLGDARGQVDSRAVWTSVLLLAVACGLALALSPRL